MTRILPQPKHDARGLGRKVGDNRPASTAMLVEAEKNDRPTDKKIFPDENR